MLSTFNNISIRRAEVLQKFNETYKPFFDYSSEIKKNLFRITFTINDQERIVRADPQFVETELEDLIAQVESAKNAIINKVRADAIKEATEKFRERMQGIEVCGHKINWTYAFEMDDMQGFLCPEENLFLPVEYDDIYERNTYSTKVHDDWEDKALKYFEENFPKSLFIKRLRCPDSLKDFVVEFAASQKMIFTKHDRYVCNVQQEYIPGVDKQVRWHFEFGDFIEKDGGWEYIKDSGIYSIYDNDKEEYLRLYNSLCEAIPDKEVTITYVDGEGLYYGKTKMRISVGPWYKEIEIDPDMDNWDAVCERVKKESEQCINLVWNKVSNCLTDFLRKDVADLISLHERIAPNTIWLALTGQKEVFPETQRSGMYKTYSRADIDEAITALVAAKIVKKEKIVKDGKTFINVVLTPWGLSMLRKYKKSLSAVEKLAQKARDDFDAGRQPGDEEAYALLKTIKANKKEKTAKDIEYVEKIGKCRNVMCIYEKTIKTLSH